MKLDHSLITVGKGHAEACSEGGEDRTFISLRGTSWLTPHFTQQQVNKLGDPYTKAWKT